MIKFKHFTHIEGQGPTKYAMIDDLEAFVNDKDVSVLEIGHSFTPAPQRSLSIFVSYVSLSEQEKEAAKLIAEEAVRRQGTSPSKDAQTPSKGKGATTLPKTTKKPSTGSKTAK